MKEEAKEQNEQKKPVSEQPRMPDDLSSDAPSDRQIT